jgi:hypothetical protein
MDRLNDSSIFNVSLGEPHIKQFFERKTNIVSYNNMFSVESLLHIATKMCIVESQGFRTR